MFINFPFYKQLNSMDCGPTALRMVAKYYGRHYNSETLRQKTGYSKSGISLLSISEAAEKIGFKTRAVKIDYSELLYTSIPSILHWNHNHFVVLTAISKKKVTVADPAKGVIQYEKNEFLSYWVSQKHQGNGTETGIALLLEPTSKFYDHEGEIKQRATWGQISHYLLHNRSRIVQILVSLIITSCLQLIVPFLTQSIVDSGINFQNLEYVVIVLIAQLTITFSQTVVGFIRGRLLLRISNVLNLQILSDFWIKLTRLPVSYFDLHKTGDTLQRLKDHNTIQNFLTSSALTTLVSIFNFIIYAIILTTYNLSLFLIFIICNIIYFGWVQLFLRIRRKINYRTFDLSSKENNATLQLIQGMQEIRLNNAETQKRWEWENIQTAIFKLNYKLLNYSQWQTTGAIIINQVQNIAISFLVAKLVIDGELTLGAMLAVQYIIGQLSGPITQWAGFIQSAQDAKISMERLNEIHQLPDEEGVDNIYLSHIPKNNTISIHDLFFTYPGAGNDPVLKNIKLEIPHGKITAIVGSSGSGKTTLLKILLKIYEQYNGIIRIGTNRTEEGFRFDMISHSYWRRICGTVMQEGYIFNDTIAHNITVGQDNIDYNRLMQSCKIANIYSFIETLPNGFYTHVGAEGTGLSQGQKQRLLIARAVYKNPKYIFFDEATNALDANNEKKIVENLKLFFKGKTVVIVAHRLSTVKNADLIVVLDKGCIIEQGSHQYLTSIKGKYYELIRNQLEFGV